jgi:hypothetical protein
MLSLVAPHPSPLASARRPAVQGGGGAGGDWKPWEQAAGAANPTTRTSKEAAEPARGGVPGANEPRTNCGFVLLRGSLGGDRARALNLIHPPSCSERRFIVYVVRWTVRVGDNFLI